MSHPVCPTGRVQIAGTVTLTRVDRSEFGEVYKITVKTDEGWIVYGTRPKGLGNIVEPGMRVSFVATVTPNPALDPWHGTFTRPIAKELARR
jgi:hypothetical protein